MRTRRRRQQTQAEPLSTGFVFEPPSGLPPVVEEEKAQLPPQIPTILPLSSEQQQEEQPVIEEVQEQPVIEEVQEQPVIVEEVVKQPVQEKQQLPAADSQCTLPDTTDKICNTQTGYAKCIEIMSKNLKIDNGKLLWQDPQIQTRFKEDILDMFPQVTAKSGNEMFVQLAQAITSCDRSKRKDVIEKFAVNLNTHIKAIHKEPLPSNYIIAVEQFINGLIDVVEDEEKHGCAGDKCGEPEDSTKFLTFNQIAGAKKEKMLIDRAFLSPLEYPKLFPTSQQGIRMLMYGVPGTGKTLFAKAVARRIRNAAYYAPTPADLKGSYVGETEKKIKNVFECVCQRLSTDPRYKIGIIFFDEFEAIASSRSNASGTSTAALSVPTLLQYIDGVAASKVSQSGPIHIIAATNLPWCLDSAILSRFPQQVHVDLPDQSAREFIIRDAFNRNFSQFGNVEPYTLQNNFIDAAKIKTSGGAYRTMFNVMGRLKQIDATKRTRGGLLLNRQGQEIPIQTQIAELMRTNPFDSLIEMMVKLTGQRPENVPDDLQQYSFTTYGYSGRDISSAMDDIVANIAFNALVKNSLIVTFKSITNVVNMLSTSDEIKVPPEIADTLFVALSENVVEKIELVLNTKMLTYNFANLDPVYKKNVVTWEYNDSDILNQLQGKGTVKDEDYRMIREYEKTKQIPEGARC